MDFNSFKFRGKDSIFDYGVYVSKNPIIVQPKRNCEVTEIPGKSGALVNDLGTYSTFLLPIECALVSKDEQDLRNKMQQVKAWLSGGEDSLILSSQPERKYLASVWDEIDISAEEEVFGSFLVNFLCQPFLYEAFASSLLSQSGTVILINMGTFKSAPKIKLYGTGNPTLIVNGVSFTITGVTTSVTVDSSLYEAYTDTALLTTSGSFPELQTGHNEVIIPEGFTADITPNWRWL